VLLLDETRVWAVYANTYRRFAVSLCTLHAISTGSSRFSRFVAVFGEWLALIYCCSFNPHIDLVAFEDARKIWQMPDCRVTASILRTTLQTMSLCYNGLLQLELSVNPRIFRSYKSLHFTKPLIYNHHSACALALQSLWSLNQSLVELFVFTIDDQNPCIGWRF
jgi:hypothetical protein